MRKWAVGLSLLGALSAPSMFMALPVQAASESSNPPARSQAIASAELMMQLEQLKVETQSLRDMVERQQRVIQRLEDNQRNRYVDTDQRLQTLRQKVDRFEELLPSLKAGAEGGATSAEARADIDASEPADTQSVPAPTESDSASSTTHNSGSAQADYTAAYALVQKKQFDAAIEAFQTFIREHPDTRLLGNAYYWIGEIYMAQNRSSEAQKMFEAVISEHPDSYKVPDSMYKLALIQARFGNQSKAEANMQSIVDQYAQSNAAKLAKAWLESKSSASSKSE
ncbi:tol-pal system protein YbgF [Terasakiispira papahanaumokuakeensis]|uniref:Cell division coordinator CpoB n=1 Tax=Terasakiispira papahanaumokuakeensis TaxID=197479 RepID=A0A1E2V8X1_9GAMM|nr:tol-pal system protein YbgF [Terasakiispira papahanaumokuakeensis]ODC03427.1 tol-pal system protein YbgF [Terasakiispira papahanaumokuakeensis]